MHADDLPLQLRPNGFDRLRVGFAAVAATARMVDHFVFDALKAAIGNAGIGDHHLGAGRDCFVNKLLRFGLAQAKRHDASDHVALAFNCADDLGFAVGAFAAAPKKTVINFDNAAQWFVERFVSCRIAQPMQDEPRGLLRDFQILGERGGRNALRVIGNEPDGREPFLQRQSGILEDRADPNREIHIASTALEKSGAFEFINLAMAAMRAIFSIAPANRPQMVNATFFGRKSPKQINEAVEMLNHGTLRKSMVDSAPRMSCCQLCWPLYTQLTYRRHLSNRINALVEA